MKYVCPECYKLYDRESETELDWICTECPVNPVSDNPPTLMKLENVMSKSMDSDIWLFNKIGLGGVFYQWSEIDLKIYVNKHGIKAK